MAHNKETLSSFIDGEELSSAEVLKELEKAPELAQTFERYHTIGDAMRDEISPAFDLDFADSVAAAIDAEPTIIAPAQTASDKVEVTKPKRADVIPFFGKIGQYGIAASVAAAMVIGVQQLNNAPSATQQDLPVLQTIPTGGYASPVSFQAAPQNDLRQELKQQQRAEQQRRMNAYIKDHLLQQRLKSQSEAEQPK